MNSTSTSSVSTISTNYRQKGKLPSANSKLYKGFIHDATSKLSVGSIPAKFETIVYRNQSQKAFGSSNQRFQQETSDTPGPQDYEFDHHYTVSKNKGLESLSKKGYGGLTSNVERKVFQQKYHDNGPGPGFYEEKSFFNNSSTLNPERSQTVQPSKLSQALKNNELMENKVQVIQPGPGEYETYYPRKTYTYKSAFISRTNRENYMKKQHVPSPGEYNIKRNILKKQAYHKGPSSSFYPEQKVKQNENLQQKLVNFLEEKKDQQEVSPGPGDYDQKLPEFLPEYSETQELSSFKKGQQDRFGDPIDKTKIKHDLIGPGAYEAYGGLAPIAEERTLVSGAAFMSETLRKPFGDFEQRLGPNLNVPYIQPRKKNFHLNLQRKWIQ